MTVPLLNDRRSPTKQMKERENDNFMAPEDVNKLADLKAKTSTVNVSTQHFFLS